MLKKSKTQKRKPSPDSLLLKTSKKHQVSLTEKDLGKVTGGMKVDVEYKPQKPDGSI
jgi:hypothetical protein